MAFSGWPEEALDFYEGLESDNSKAYWTAHKDVYERFVLGPMTDLLDELASEFGEPRLFRPYRDVRFSKDKSPYKTNIGATVGDGYIQLSASGLAAGSGYYQMAPDQLDRYRRAVATDLPGEELERLTARIVAAGIEVEGREVLKTAPRGFTADHPRIELLRYKGIIAWKQWPVEPWLGTPQARQHVAGFLKAATPLADWLAKHVGPSQLESADRRR